MIPRWQTIQSGILSGSPPIMVAQIQTWQPTVDLACASVVPHMGSHWNICRSLMHYLFCIVKWLRADTMGTGLLVVQIPALPLIT